MKAMHYFFYSQQFLSNVCGRLLTLQTLHTISCVNRLMPAGNNRSPVLNKPAKFTYRFLSIYGLFLPPDIKVLNVRRYLSLIILTQTFLKASRFSTLSVRYKDSKISPEYYVKIIHLTFKHKRNYAVLMILQVIVQSGTRQLTLCDSTLICQENGCA